MSTLSRGLFRSGLSFMLVAMVLITGCQSPDSDRNRPPDPDTSTVPSAEQDIDASTPATSYLTYAYQGALLSSDHPLNDSLSALTSSPMGGRRLTVIDTFVVESIQEAEESEHIVQVRFPHSVQIQSATWEMSDVVMDQRESLRVRQKKVHDAPHVVGWPAFQRHIRDVAPDRADSILARIGPKLNQSSIDAEV